MADFTVKQVQPSGKTHDTFGTEYWVKLDNGEAAKLWFKKAPQPGEILDLEKSGNNYKKVKKEWNQKTSSSQPSTQNSSSSKKSSKTFKDNSLGMRIGMVINNAANYVNSLDIRDDAGEPRILNDREWAETVASYARALFPLSNLEDEFAQPEAPITSEDNPFL